MLLRKSSIIMLAVLFSILSNNLLAQDSLEISKQKAKDIIEKYLDAIGGRDALSKVEDRTTIMRGTACLLYTSTSPRDRTRYRMPSPA